MSLIDTLRAHHVPFLICGAVAMAHHGYTRPTDDLDILVSPDHMQELREALAHIIDTSDIPFDKSHDGILIRIGTPPDRVDITTRIDGPTFAEAYTSRSGDFIGFDALLANKLASPRPKDHRDAARLIEILRKRAAMGLCS